jgi:ubiquinone/menaquinone biosynthesis C-methylase UbiE
VARARSRLAGELAERVTFEVGSARQIDIPGTQFDIVVFSWSL